MYEEDEVDEYWSDEALEGGNKNADDQENVVVSGDAAAAAAQGKVGVKSMKDRRIANEDRMTTPYMTKYEKARILGTRALQIR